MVYANISKATRRAVYQRDGWRCAVCDSNSGLQIHHAIRRSQGGSNEPENLVTLCWRCHAVAHNTPPYGTPDYMDADWMEQAIVEYVSDYYAEQWTDEQQEEDRALGLEGLIHY